MYPSKKRKEKKWTKTNLFPHIILTFQGCRFDIFFLEIPFVTKHATILWTHFLNGGFKLLRNASKDYVGFLDHLGIYLEVPATVHVSIIETSRNYTVQDSGCMLAISQCCGTQATLTQEQLYAAEHCLDEENAIEEDLIISTGYIMIKESFQYHLVILLTYLYSWRTDLLIRPSFSNRKRQPTSLSWLTFADEPFSCWMATIEPCLSLIFCFMTVMMNPGFISSDNTRKKAWILGDLCHIFQTHWTTTLHFFSLEKMRNHVEQMRFIPSSFVKMRRINILRMCRSSASFWMDEWQSYSITDNTVLMLTSVMTVLSIPP